MTIKSQSQADKENTPKQQPQQSDPQGLDTQVEQGSPAIALQRAMGAHPSLMKPADILALQQTVGNQAVQSILQIRSQRQAANGIKGAVPNSIQANSSLALAIQRFGDENVDVKLRDAKGEEITKKASEIKEEKLWVLFLYPLAMEPVEVRKADIKLEKDEDPTCQGRTVSAIWDKKPELLVFMEVRNKLLSSTLGPIQQPGEPRLFKGMKGQAGVRYEEIIGKPFIGDPKSSDVTQGIGDCYFMATIASIADTEEGKKLIKAHIEPKEGMVKDYLVTFPFQEGDQTQQKDQIKITSKFPITDQKFRESFAYGLSGKKIADATDDVPTVALWPVILEKAYAIHKEKRKQLKEAAAGGYNLLPGGLSEDVFKDLGIKMEVLYIRNQQKATIIGWLEGHRGDPITAATLHSEGGVQHIVGESPFNQGIYKHRGPLRKEEITIGFFKDPEKKDEEQPAKLDDQGQVWKENKPVGQIDFQKGQVTLKPEVTPAVHLQIKQDKIDFPGHLTAGHDYAVKAFDDKGLTLYNPDRGGEVPVNYDDFIKVFFNLTAGKLK